MLPSIPDIFLAIITGLVSNESMNRKLRIKILLIAILWGAAVAVVQAQETPPAGSGGTVTLVQAVMCESIQGYEPRNVAAVFSIETGQVSCFTSFDDISAATHTLHKWYRRDTLVTTKRLTLRPPRWSTYSSIQLREADKGPWRVEIWSAGNRLLQTLRFSVAE